jgi:hypothetical protein
MMIYAIHFSVKWLRGKVSCSFSLLDLFIELLQGYVVHEAADGQSGVDIFRSHPIFESVCQTLVNPF